MGFFLKEKKSTSFGRFLSASFHLYAHKLLPRSPVQQSLLPGTEADTSVLGVHSQVTITH